MIVLKVDVMAKLKEKGYTSYRIRQEKLLSQKMLTEMRSGKVPGMVTLDTICRLLHCQPGQLIKYVPDTESGTENSVE